MAEADTSSYPKPAAPAANKTVLDQLGQYQGLEQQRIGIDQSKLKLANNQFGILNKEISTLIANPNTTPEDVINRSQQFVKMGLVPADMHAKFISQLPTKQTLEKNPQALHQFLENTLTRAMTIAEAVNFNYGVNGLFTQGQQATPIVQSPKFGMRATGAPIQLQNPPGTEVSTPRGNQLLGAQQPQTVPGTVGIPPQDSGYNGPPNSLPVGPINNPAIRGQSNNFDGNVIGANVEPPQPRGPMTSQPPMFDEGKKMLAEDQALATNKLTAIKPALQALPLLEGLRSGPTTAKFNDVVAALKANGLISIGSNDPTAIYQEVNKKLAQYISSNPVGQRSDAAQTLAEAASPSPKTQISPALIKLTKDAIILDRVQAARAGAFEGNDYSKYGNHRSTFPASIDERAFGIDLMKPDERKTLLTEMKKKQNTFEGKKFWRSLAIVDKQGLIDTAAE